MLHHLQFLIHKITFILFFTLAILQANGQNTQIKYSEKLIYDNWSNGYYKEILGSANEMTYILYHNYRMSSRSKKNKILVFDKNLKIVNKAKIKGYSANRNDKKTVPKINRLTYLTSFIKERQIIVVWQQQIKTKKNIYLESFDLQLNPIHEKTLISSFESSPYSAYTQHYDYVIDHNEDKIIVINNSASDVKNAAAFHYKIIDLNFHTLKEKNFHIDDEILKLTNEITYKMLHFDDKEVLFECNNTVLSLDLERNEVNHYTPDLAGKHVVISSQTFVIDEKVIIIGLYTKKLQDDDSQENGKIEGLFYDEVSNSSKSIQLYDFSSQERATMNLSYENKIHFGLKMVSDTNYLILFNPTDHNFFNIVSIDPNTKINWVRNIENDSDFHIIENRNDLLSIEFNANYGADFQSINCTYITDKGEVKENTYTVDTHPKFNSKKTNYSVVKNNNKIYILLKKKVIKPVGLLLKLGSIPMWPAAPFTFLNGSLYRHNGQIVEITLKN